MTDNYPMGTADDPKAPWNQKEEPFKSVDVSVVTVMIKYCTLWNRGESLEESYSNSEYSIQDMLDMLKIYVFDGKSACKSRSERVCAKEKASR